uniref:GPI-anchored protein LLG1-like domain-containing protein n=1 Tax=Leersia perrieri TaxID=77586 RepID=A0A0D9WPM0_9ORYZ
MALNLVFLFFLFLFDGVLQVMGGSMTRSLLQAKKSCPISIEYQNYSIITSKCKAPQYPANLCCAAFTEFACPLSQYINDESTDCGDSMWSYLNTHGNYPPGLFSLECQGGKDGLPCNGSSSSNQTSGGSSTQGVNGISEVYSLVITLTVFGLGMLMLY